MSITPLPVTVIEQLTPAWLTAVLRSRGELSTGSVAAVDAERIGSGQLGATYALTLTYEGATADGPATLVAKLPATAEVTREFAARRHCYSREVKFYDQVAPGLEMRSPRLYWTTLSEDGRDFCLLMEDLRSDTVVDQQQGCDPNRAAAALGQAAAMHAGSWRDERLLKMDWLIHGIRGVRERCAAMDTYIPAFLERYDGLLDDATQRVASGFADGAMMRWFDRMKEPLSLWHGDFRLDNLLFDGCGGDVPIAVIDWQSVTLGYGPVDAAYFLGVSMTTELRREHEEALVRGYHRGLVSLGVPGYSWDQCMEDYRVNAVWGFLIAVVAGLSTQRTPEADALFTMMAARHSANLEDQGTLALLGA